MLKSVLICFSTCLAFNYPVESATLLFFTLMLNFNLAGLSYYNLLVDNLSSNLMLLTFFIIMLCMLTNNKLSLLKKYLMCNMLLLMFLVSSFSSNSLLFFFILFESSLMPLFMLILGWGYQPERLQSSMYFLFYTLFGSLPLLMMIISFSKLSVTSWTTKILMLDMMAYIGLMFAFLVKMPMFLVHLWLPKAHVEAPTMGSMILAGVTLKLGSYALLRIFYLTSSYSVKHNWIWISISLVGNLLLCIVCLRQTDLKALMAYSSVVHMGLCLLTILFLLNWSYEGGLWLSLSHGLASSGLFFLTNSTYLRFNSRSLYINKGLAFSLPMMSTWWFLLLMFNMASPPSLNLFSEIKMVATTTSMSFFVLLLSVITSFFCAAYCLFLFSNIFHGKHNNSQKFSNNLMVLENFISFYHLWPLMISMLLLYFIQWIM